jgi:hypothetical protein
MFYSYNTWLLSKLPYTMRLSKVTGKGHPITGHQGPRGGVEV